MGTRHLTIVKKDHSLKVCQYGQWDGYLSGQGKTIYSFCKSKRNINKLRITVDKVVLGMNNFSAACEAYNHRVDSESRTDEDKYWYDCFLSRDVGGEILQNIINCHFDFLPPELEGKLGLIKYRDFDQLVNYGDTFIEYSYIIDLDDNKLEVWSYGKKIRDCDLNNMPTEAKFLKEDEE